MASFSEKLRNVLAAATHQGVLPTETADRLLAFAVREDSDRHVAWLTTVLACLGGAVVAVGVSLLVAANWEYIPGLTKIAGFLLLLATVHGIALWLQWTGKPYARTAHALHFLGALMFLAGIGLIAQVYNLHSHPSNGVLLWLVAILPIVVLLRSAPLAGVWIVGLIVWAHMEGAIGGSFLQMWDIFSAHVFLEVALGVALIGFSVLLGAWDRGVGKVASFLGILMLAGGLYILGFYRHWSDSYRSAWLDEGIPLHGLILPGLAFALALAGLFEVWRSLLPRFKGLRLILMACLLLILLTGSGALLAEAHCIPPGPGLSFWNFGSSDRFTAAQLLFTVGAWVAWFALSAWCLAYGAAACRKGFVNLGVVGIGLGVITRFCDLAVDLSTTGWLFIVGGLAMGVTAWAMEHWRRFLLSRMETPQ